MENKTTTRKELAGKLKIEEEEVEEKSQAEQDMELFILILQAVREKYNDDKCAPGILFSYIRRDGLYQYYAVVNRYRMAFGQQKEVVFRCYANELREALVKIGEFLVEKTPMEKLMDRQAKQEDLFT